jgi:hypothetical protein
MGEVVAAHAVLGLEMTDHRFDGGASFHVALDLRGDAALLTGGVDLELVIGRRVVSAVSGIGDSALDDIATMASLAGMTVASVWPSYGLPGSAATWATNCPPLQ